MLCGEARYIRETSMSSAVAEVMVIDAPAGVPIALGAYRPRHERNHLLCRWPGEQPRAFHERVSKRLALIRRGTKLAALTLVLGDDDALEGAWSELTRELALSVAPAGIITVVGAGAPQEAILECVERLRQLVEPTVTLEVSFGGVVRGGDVVRATPLRHPTRSTGPRLGGPLVPHAPAGAQSLTQLA